MTSPFDKLVEWAGGREALGKNTLMARVLRFQRGVAESGEFRRIKALPRRRWEDAADLEELVELLTKHCRVAGDVPESLPSKLKLVQAAAIREAHDVRGGFFPIGVGRGKTLISLLAPVVMRAERPILFVPPRLRDQTRRILPQLRPYWKFHPRLRIIGYSELSLAKNADMLEKLEPDLVILDECHRVKARGSARTKRLLRYFKDHPETKCLAMSGTVTKRSIKDYAHILQWCLKDDMCPVPIRWQELTDWADALDADVPDDKRVAPGALEQFCINGGTVREGFQRRLVETPGVINSVGQDDVDASLVVERWAVTAPASVSSELTRLRNSWETPNGDVVTEATDLWRHAREIALGFWYRWEPPPPREWMKARREWKQYVRETLRNNRRGLDSELQVWNECSRDHQHDHCQACSNDTCLWWRWEAIKNTFKPNTVAEWITEDVIDAAAAWLANDRGIAWTEHVAFAEKLAAVAEVPYFGAGDDGILDHEGPCVVSIRAHSEGKNLQGWSRSLVLAPPAAGDRWEQLLGRTHRPGQQADEVTYEAYLGCDELRDGFRQARADARYLEDTLGARQKLNYCNLVGVG